MENTVLIIDLGTFLSYNAPMHEQRELHQRQTERYDTDIHSIRQRIAIGVFEIKEGHKVAHLNPTGEAMQVPLSEAQITRLKWNLAVLEYRKRAGGHAVLPEELRSKDPNHFRSPENRTI